MSPQTARRSQLARRADKYDLYQRSVQSPEADVSFARRVFKRHFGRKPSLLREDFCGTAAISCHWVKSDPHAQAFGVDLDPEPLAWGRQHNVGALRPSATSRIKLIRGDVRTAKCPPVDITLAFNFSYFTFKTRQDLLRYFKKARTTLRRQGLFMMDAYGGPDAQQTTLEARRRPGFRYRWEQARFDPISHHTLCYIHFDFPDKSRMRRAFTYDWRLWTIPEIRELLKEAGFRHSEVYWEGTDLDTGEANGVYTQRDRAPDDPAWVAYIAAKR